MTVSREVQAGAGSGWIAPAGRRSRRLRLPRRALVVATAACAVLAGSVACSDDGDGAVEQPTSDATTAASLTRTTPRAGGPAADLATELTGGNGVFIGEAEPPDLGAGNYVEQEFLAAGTASSYRAEGELTEDGRWTFAPDSQTAPYRTRVVVRRPAEVAAFSGTVVFEWLNVSGGVDADPEWTSLSEEIMRQGDVWVGVSAQRIGVMGGPVLVTAPGGEGIVGKGLKALDPARYGSLDHPGDGFAFDMYTQVARAVGGGAGLAAGMEPSRLIAAGESQSAFALVTYYNGVQPLTREFDGFFVHSRGAAGLPLVAPGEHADLAGAIGRTPTIFRTDQDAPVLNPQTESDLTGVLNSYAARQPDGDRYRLWEVAGTAHADAHLLGPDATLMNCGLPINNGPMHVVAKAALRALTTWITTGTAPASAPRLEVSDGAAPQIQRDADGIATGGVRTPPVDVPVATLSGEPGPDPSTLCLLLGSTKPFEDGRLAELYPTRDAYLERYEAEADAAIAEGYVLAEDRDALVSFAEPDRLSS